MFLSVVIPAYNESRRLSPTLRRVHEFLVLQEYSSEIIVVNDGSTDDTAAVVKELTGEIPELRLITNSPNQGKGAAVRRGMLEAKGQYRLFMDADGSTSIEEIKKLLPFVDEYDIVIGSRHLMSGSIKIKQPLKRRIISRGSNLLIRVMAVPGIHDTQCGFKLFSAHATHETFNRQTAFRWLFDVELLVIARTHGLKVKEVAVDWADAPNSVLRASRAVTRSLKELLWINQGMRQGRYRQPIPR